jgi:hypothetical protein
MSDNFLKELRQNLKGFPSDEQTLILEEIRSHIDSAGQDNNANPELGSAAQMGSEFKKVYRPNRLRDLLLVIIPAYFVFPLLLLPIFMISGQTPPKALPMALMVDIRLVILIGILCAWVGHLKHATLVCAYWVPAVCCTVFALINRESRWPWLTGSASQGMLENSVWILLLAGFLVWSGRLLWKNRADLLIVAFTLLPFLTAALNFGGQTLLTTTGASSNLLQISISGVQFPEMLDLGFLICFFLLPGRNLRWLALFINETYQAANNALSMRALPLVFTLWCLLAGLVLAFWLLDRKTQAGRFLA